MIALFVFIILNGLFIYRYFHKHLLCILLRLEYIVLRLFCIIYYLINLYNYEIYFSLIYLVISVCEGALGLSVIVIIVRIYGNDYFSSLNVLLC